MPTHVESVEELASMLGRELGTSTRRQVTQSMIDQFADLTDDHQWLHVNPTMAAEGPFGATVAHGYLTLSLIAPIIHEVLTTSHQGFRLNYGLNRVRFPRPVLVDSFVWATVTLGDFQRLEGAIQILLDVVVHSSHADEPVCVAQGVYRFYLDA